MHERYEAVLGQLGLAPVANGDLGGALHVDATVIRREGVAQHILYRTAGLHSTYRGAPAIFFERSVDVGRHRIRGIRPGIAIVAGAVRSEEHTSELQSLMRISYAVFCLKKKKHKKMNITM